MWLYNIILSENLASRSSILETRGSSLELWWSSFSLPWSGTVSIIFLELKYLKTSLTTILIWQPLRKLTFNFYSLLLSQLPFSSSFESLFNQTNIQYSAVIWAWAFSVAQIAPKCGQSIRRVCPVFSWNSLYQWIQIPFGGPPFLKRGPLKLFKGAHLTLIGQFLE